MSRELPQQAKDLLDAANIVTVATVNPDGSPQSSLLWATYDGDDVLMSTIEGRAKHRNFLRDPREKPQSRRGQDKTQNQNQPL